MSLGTEEEGATEESAFRNDDDASSILWGEVDDSLYGAGLQQCTVILNSVIGDDIPFAQGVCIHLLGLQEPRVHLRAVGP